MDTVQLDPSPAVEFEILGPLRVRRSGTDIRLAGVRQRTLLAALLLTWTGRSRSSG